MIVSVEEDAMTVAGLFGVCVTHERKLGKGPIVLFDGREPRWEAIIASDELWNSIEGRAARYVEAKWRGNVSGDNMPRFARLLLLTKEAETPDRAVSSAMSFGRSC